ncbi:hypothetical protein B0I72DRAFT_170938 [Yarrowia lipolytica]|nr:hypothetical protein B0I72DRAFT_170938 [Yarrowia lipolytica]
MPPSCFFFFFVAGAVSGDGTFLLGSIDHAKYSGKISYDTAPYPSTGAVINLDTITVNGTDVSFDESALLDSGLIVIAISDPQFKTWQYLGLHRPAVSACKLVPEKKTPTQPSIWITRKLDWS